MKDLWEKVEDVRCEVCGGIYDCACCGEIVSHFPQYVYRILVQFCYGFPKDSGESVHSSPPPIWRNADRRIPSRLLIVYRCACVVGLSSDLGLQVPDQLRCGFAGEVFKAGNVEAGKHLCYVGIVIVCPSAECK